MVRVVIGRGRRSLFLSAYVSQILEVLSNPVGETLKNRSGRGNESGMEAFGGCECRCRCMQGILPIRKIEGEI